MDIDAIARLAKLQLSVAERSQIEAQFQGIMREFEALSDVPDGALPERSAVPLSALRPDAVQDCIVATREALLRCSPHARGNFLSLPPVF